MNVTKGYGFSVNDINWSCPSELKPYEDAYFLSLKQHDTEMYMQGLYFREALLSSVCNNSLWMKSGSSPYKYPEKTYTELMEEKEMNENMTDDEKKKQTELLFEKLSIMQMNFEHSHDKKA